MPRKKVPHTPGVYCLKNYTNGKIYIGMSQDIEKRVKQHIGKLRDGLHNNSAMQEDWDKGHQFDYEVVEVVVDDKMRHERELYFIKTLNATDPSVGYNVIVDSTRPERVAYLRGRYGIDTRFDYRKYEELQVCLLQRTLKKITTEADRLGISKWEHINNILTDYAKTIRND